MTCPDGKTFASTLSACPKNSNATTTPPPQTYTKCPDGTLVLSGVACPQTQTVSCANGGTAPTLAQCAPTQTDTVTVCLKNGGTWCSNDNTARAGFCAPRGSMCPTNSPQQENPKLLDQNQQPQEPNQDNTKQNQQFDAQQNAQTAKQLGREKSDLLRQLKSMERFFTRVKDAASLAKISALKDKINAVTATDPALFDTLQAIRDEVDNVQAAYTDAAQNGTADQSNRDQQFQDHALAQLKSGTKQFARFLQILDSRVKQTEKQGVAVPQSITDTIASAHTIMDRINAAQSYDELSDIVDQIPELGQTLNDVLPQLDQLVKVPRALKLIAGQINLAKQAIKQAQTVADRYKLDVADQIDSMNTMLTDVTTATDNIKSGQYDGDISSYIQDNIINNVNDIRRIGGAIRAVAGVQGYVKQITNEAKRYTRTIANLQKNGEDVTDATAALDDLTTKLQDLKTLASKKITADNAGDVIDAIQAVSDAEQVLVDAAGGATPDALQRQLEQSLQTNTSNVKPLQVNSLEKLIVRAYRTATFFRNYSPYRNLALLF